MQGAYLVRKLYIPISLAFLVTLILGLVFPWRGILINFAAAFFGILITVGYVDFVIREHEKSRWHATRKRIDSRIESVATGSATQFRFAYGFGADIYNLDCSVMLDAKKRRAETIRITDNILAPSTPSKIRALDTKKWKWLTKQMQITWQGADRILEVYGGKLKPDLYSMILDLQEKMWMIKSAYDTFPDLIGIPDEVLRKEGSNAIETKNAYLELIEKDVLDIFRLSTSILKVLD